MEDFLAPLLLGAVAVAAVGALYASAAAIRVERAPKACEPCLSGWSPVEHAVSRYYVRWYPITMIFLALRHGDGPEVPLDAGRQLDQSPETSSFAR